MVKSQRVSLGVSSEVNFPTGNAANISGIGVGAGLKAEFRMSGKYAVTANSAYNIFIGKKYFGNRMQNIQALPTKLGFKYYTTPDFYIEGQMGAAFHLNGNAKTSFIWSPGFGTYFKTANAANKISFGLRYEAWANTSYGAVSSLKTTSFGFVGLKLGYEFGL